MVRGVGEWVGVKWFVRQRIHIVWRCIRLLIRLIVGVVGVFRVLQVRGLEQAEDRSFSLD